MENNIIRFQKPDGRRHITINNIKILDGSSSSIFPLNQTGNISQICGKRSSGKLKEM